MFFFNFSPPGKKLKEQSQKFSYCLNSVFISKGKIVKVRESDKTVDIDDYENDVLHKSIAGLPPVEAVFPASLGKVILKAEPGLILYDITNK